MTDAVAAAVAWGGDTSCHFAQADQRVLERKATRKVVKVPTVVCATSERV